MTYVSPITAFPSIYENIILYCITYIYIYIYIYTHTHTHIYIYISHRHQPSDFMKVSVKGKIVLLWQPNVPVLLDEMLNIINFRLNKNSVADCTTVYASITAKSIELAVATYHLIKQKHYVYPMLLFYMH